MRSPLLALAALVLASAISADRTEAALPHSYSEDFATRTYCDTLNTTAHWNTAAGTLGLPPLVTKDVGSLWLPGGLPQDVAIWGDILVVADGDAGVRVIDVTDPSNPVLRGTYDTAGSAHEVIISGDVVYVADGAAGFAAIDITNLSNPTYLGGADTPGTVCGIALDGKYLYVADGTQGFKVYDVSSPASPVLKATYFVSGTFRNVDVAGDHAYFCGVPTGVVIVDVSNPASMVPVATLNTPGSAYDVTVVGGYAYIADSASGLQIADVSDPTNPVIVGAIANSMPVDHVDVDGPFAYLANGGGDLWIVDVSDPAAPVSVASHSLPGATGAAIVDGALVYAVDYPGGVSVVEVAQFVGPFLGVTLDDFQGGGVHAAGTRVYVGANSAFRIYDVADPGSPSLLGSVAMPQKPQGIDVVGSYAFVTVGTSGFRVVDVSDPETPVVVGSYQGGSGSDELCEITVVGDFAYITAPVNRYLHILDVHDPTNPVVANTVLSGCLDFALAGGHGYYPVAFYTAVYSATVQGANVWELDSTDLQDFCTDIAVAGDLAYACGEWALAYIDVSNPGNIFEVDYSPVNAVAPLTIVIVGERIFVVACSGFLEVHGAAPGTFYSAATVHPHMTPADADAAGDYLFATGDAGLSFIEILQRAFDVEANAARSLDVAGSPHTIRKARLSTTQTDAITWQLSANGGATWQAFQPDAAWHAFTAPGTDLRWRSTHEYRGLGVDPVCTDIFIDWLCDFGILDVVRDVPNDQGRMARLSWTRSAHDFIGDPTQVTGYAVYRRIDQWARGARVVADDATGPDRLYPPGDWEYVVTVPACCEDVYRTVVPTVCDSTLAGGLCESVFFVRTLTATPGVHFDSPPDSGYSVDNLAPAPPLGLLAEGDASSVDLAWEVSEEVDFDYYTVYRSTDEGFSSPELLGHTSAPSFTDDDPPQASEWWYRVTATDFAGNESVQSAAAGVSGTGVPDGVPASFALASPVPNPAAGSIAIGYSVPAPAAGASVKIGVYDSAGRLVRQILDGPQAAGTHSAVWDCRDESGAEAASGVYFCRMEAGAFMTTRKVIVVR